MIFDHSERTLCRRAVMSRPQNEREGTGHLAEENVGAKERNLGLRAVVSDKRQRHFPREAGGRPKACNSIFPLQQRLQPIGHVQSQEHTLFDDAKLCSQELASFSRPCFAYRAEIAETTCNVSSARACLCIPKPDLACDLDLLACLLDAHACLAGAAKSREAWAAGPKCPLPRGTEAVIQRKWRKLPLWQSLEKSLVCAAAALRTHSIVGAAPLFVQRV